MRNDLINQHLLIAMKAQELMLKQTLNPGVEIKLVAIRNIHIDKALELSESPESTPQTDTGGFESDGQDF